MKITEAENFYNSIETIKRQSNSGDFNEIAHKVFGDVMHKATSSLRNEPTLNNLGDCKEGYTKYQSIKDDSIFYINWNNLDVVFKLF